MAGRSKRPPEPATPARARDTALRALARREHSQAELKAKLGRRGHDVETVDDVVAALSESGWQSDARYTETLIRSRLRQGCGPLRIEHELEAAGVARAQIRAALEAAEVDWSAACVELHAHRFGAAPESAAEWQKQYRFLAGRGFTPEQIRAALKREWD